MSNDVDQQLGLVRFIEIAALALVYFVTAKFAQSLAILPDNLSAIWIPSGVVFAAVLLRGNRVWPGILIGAFTATAFSCIETELVISSCMLVALLQGLGMTLGTLLAASLVRKYTLVQNPLHRSEHIAILFISTVPAALIAAFFITLASTLTSIPAGVELMWVAISTFSSHVVGILVITPLILCFIGEKRRIRMTELPFYSLILLVLMALGFGLVEISFPTFLPLFMITPILIWSVLRLCEQVTFISIVIISLLATELTRLGLGPFATGQSLNSLLELQLFIIAMSSTILLLNSVVNERQAASRKLEETYYQLEHLVDERTQDLSEALQREKAVNEQLQSTQEQLIRSQKREALGTLTGGIAHNFNNILNAIIGNAELALMKMSENSETSRHMDAIMTACKRASILVRQIRNYARLSHTTFQPFNLLESVRESISLAKAYTNDHIKIELKTNAEEIIINGDIQALNTALLNILENACQSMWQTSGTISVLCSKGLQCPARLATSFDECACICIIDEGQGISEKIIDKVFDPFFTTREIGQGAGLGLSATQGIIESHDGVIEASSDAGEGAMFTIYLPMYGEYNPEPVKQQDVIEPEE